MQQFGWLRHCSGSGVLMMFVVIGLRTWGLVVGHKYIPFKWV